MSRFIKFTLCAAILWFLYPDEAWCAGCKKCNERALALRKRFLEEKQKEQSQAEESYDISMTDWKVADATGDAPSTDKKDKDKKDDSKKKKKKKKDKDKDKKATSTSGS